MTPEVTCLVFSYLICCFMAARVIRVFDKDSGSFAPFFTAFICVAWPVALVVALLISIFRPDDIEMS